LEYKYLVVRGWDGPTWESCENKKINFDLIENNDYHVTRYDVWNQEKPTMENIVSFPTDKLKIR
jgi:hypothetical protein